MLKHLDTKSFFHEVIKLDPKDDLREKIETHCKLQSITAASMVSAVGSLEKLCLRKANSNLYIESNERHELLTLQGLLSNSGVHLHASVANEEGRVFGGHLMPGNKIYTTCEIVICVYPELIFDRVFDPVTGYKELSFKRLKS